MKRENAAALREQGESFKVLERKAADGSLSMEELANFGKGLDLFTFSEGGDVVRPDDPEARHKGHMGKAALIGVPWKFHVGFDRGSLSKLIDKLNAGKPLSNLLMKAGLYIVH